MLAGISEIHQNQLCMLAGIHDGLKFTRISRAGGEGPDWPHRLRCHHKPFAVAGGERQMRGQRALLQGKNVSAQSSKCIQFLHAILQFGVDQLAKATLERDTAVQTSVNLVMTNVQEHSKCPP